MGDTAEAPPAEAAPEAPKAEAEPPKEEPPKEEPPKEEPPKEEPPKEEPPKEEPPKEEPPKEEPPKEEPPKEEAPKEEAPKEEPPKEEAPKEEAPKGDAPKEEAPKEEAPKEEAPKEEAPKEEGAPKGDAQKEGATPSKEKVSSKEDLGGEKKKSETTVDSKGGPEEEKPKDAASDQRSAQDVSQQRSSKLSVSSLGKRQSGDDSKDMFVRRKSTRSIKNAVGSIVSFRRGSIAEYFDRQKTVKFMNTYKLDSEKPFNVDAVTKILEEVLVEALENLTYDVDKVPKQAKWASSAIRAKVKEQEFDRYKIICIVTIGEKRSQDMFSTYRFLWDVDRDKHASFVYENMYVFAVACCFGLYYE